MNKKTFGFLTVSALVLLTAIGCSSSKEAARAMYDWEAGTSFAYEMTQEQTQAIEIPGQGMQENTSKLVTDFSLVATGPYEFTITVTDVEATGSPIPVDPLRGLESAVVTDAQGVISSASGLEENAYISARGGAELFVEDLQVMFQVLPDEPLAPGVTWTRVSSIPFSQQGLNLTREITETYTCKELTAVDGAPAFAIEVVSEVEMMGGGNQGGQEMDVTLNGDFTGMIMLDAMTGALLSSEQTGSMSGVIDMAAASLPMTMEMSISAKRAE